MVALLRVLALVAFCVALICGAEADTHRERYDRCVASGGNRSRCYSSTKARNYKNDASSLAYALKGKPPVNSR